MKLKSAVVAAAAAAALGFTEKPARSEWQPQKDNGHRKLRALRKQHRQNVKRGRA